LQHTDRRVIFVIPFEDKFSLIGTTDELLSGAPEEATVGEAEIEYLCEVVGNYFSAPVQPRDVVWSFTGVRSLFDDDADDPSAVTRDYVFDLNEEGGDAPLLSVFGGKITTYRQLADEALAALQPYFPAMGDPWTAGATLPGGDLPDENLAAYTDRLIAQCAKLDQAMLAGLARRHGMLATAVLRGAQEPADLGSDLGAGLWTREVDYMIAHEWARTGEDVLWRRSKAGIHMNAQQRAVVNTYVAAAAEEYMALGNRREA
jgi:glycerol-3-phosphate dehydrogenase